MLCITTISRRRFVGSNIFTNRCDTMAFASGIMNAFILAAAFCAHLHAADAFLSTTTSYSSPSLRHSSNSYTTQMPPPPTTCCQMSMLATTTTDLLTTSKDTLGPFTYPLAFLASFRTGAALSVMNYPRAPSIEGQVGSRMFRLPSGTRVKLFYPTTRDATTNSMDGSHNNMAPYCTDGKQTANGMAKLVGFQALGLTFLLSHLSSASSGCFQNAPIDNTTNANENSQLPLLIYSHGFGGNMDMASYLFRTMASKGMIVAALEHTDGTASSTVLPNGDERTLNEYFMTSRQQLTRRASELLEAAEFLPKELGQNDAIEVGTIMLGGHSYGAPSAVMAANGANAESNIAGVILHDPALGMGYGMLPPNGAKGKVPTISYVSDEYHKNKVRYGDCTIHIRGCKHGNFVDAPLWAPIWIMRLMSFVIPVAGSSDPIEIHEQLAESAAAFMELRDAKSGSVVAGHLFEPVN